MLSHKLSRSPDYKWWVFAAVGLGSFTGVMTFGTVNVALPTIAGHFETDLPTVQWVVIAQTLIGALLLMGSKLFFRESRGVRFDWPGAAMSTAAMVSMGYAPDLSNVSGGEDAGLQSSFVSGMNVLYLAMGCLLLVGVVASFLKGPSPAGTGRRRRRAVGMPAGD